MNSQQNNAGSLVFKRSLEGGKIWVRTECNPGSVTVLQDENGADLPAYEAFFYGNTSQERIIIELNQQPADLAHAYLIGFNDTLPAHQSIKEFLTCNGYTSEEVDKLIKEYELDKVHYLPCAHLPQMPQRIVQILGALRSNRPAFVLKDPFMPFSGRWREHFAKTLHENALQHNRVIVCTNLSFVPQTWSQGNLMQYLDVGHAADEARARYRWEQERKEREAQQEKLKKVVEQPVAAAPAPSSAPLPEVEKKDAPADASALPESLQFVYREVQDRIFTPLKEFSDFMRSYAALVILGCFTILIATMGVVFSPNLGEYQEKLAALSNGASISSLWESKPAPAIIVAPVVEEEKPISVEEETMSDENSALALPDYDFEYPSIEVGETNEIRYALENNLLDKSVCEAIIPAAPGSDELFQSVSGD